MTRHVSVAPRSRGSARAAAFLRQERAEKPHPTTLTLQSRPANAGKRSAMALHFLRIARGRLT